MDITFDLASNAVVNDGQNASFEVTNINGIPDYSAEVIYDNVDLERIWPLVKGNAPNQYYFGGGDTVDQDGKVFVTNDNFQTVQIFNDVAGTRNCRGLFVTSTGAVLQGFSDYGTTPPLTTRLYRDNVEVYTNTSPSDSRNISIIFEWIGDLYAFVNDRSGLIIKSVDDGQTWSTFLDLSATDDRFVTVLEDGDYILVGTGYVSSNPRGSILRIHYTGTVSRVYEPLTLSNMVLFKLGSKFVGSFDNGSTWVESTDGITWLPYSGAKTTNAPSEDGHFWVEENGKTWLATKGNSVAYTDDDGVSWNEVPVPNSGVTWSVAPEGNGNIIVTSWNPGQVVRLTYQTNLATIEYYRNGILDYTGNPYEFTADGSMDGDSIVARVSSGVDFTDSDPVIMSVLHYTTQPPSLQDLTEGDLLSLTWAWSGVKSSNLLSNHSFETGDLTGWDVQGSVSVRTGTANWDILDGGNSYVYGGTPNVPFILSQTVPVEGGSRYYANCNAYTSPNFNDDGTVEITIEEKNSTGGTIRTTTISNEAISFADNLKYVDGVIDLDPQATQAIVSFIVTESNSVNNDAYLDSCYFGTADRMSESSLIPFVNADFSNGLNGWNTTNCIHNTSNAGYGFDPNGKNYIVGGGFPSCSFSQRVSLSGGYETFEIKYWHGGYSDTDRGRLTVRFYDAISTLIGESVTPYYEPFNDGYDETTTPSLGPYYWKKMGFNFPIPSGAVEVELFFEGVRGATGTVLNYQVSDILAYERNESIIPLEEATPYRVIKNGSEVEETGTKLDQTLTYTIPSVALDDAGTYQLEITNGGRDPFLSDPVVVNVAAGEGGGFCFNTFGGSVYCIQAIEYTPSVLINYTLVEKSNRRHYPVDRGVQTDRYSTKLNIKGKPDYLNGLVKELQLLRENQQPVVLNNIPERIFGDHVDISGPISCFVYNFGEQANTQKNRQDIEITFIVDTASLSFVGTDTPPQLTCLKHKWKGFSEWNTQVVETYERDLQFVDREADRYVFEGEYHLDQDENANLHNFWRNVARGNVINIDESDFGVEKMFGGSIDSTNHDVVINDISYEQLSPNMRAVKIELIRN